MAVFNQIFIQKYWLGDKTINEVLSSYGNEVFENKEACETAKAVLVKSKKDFYRGSPILFKDNIDKKILDIFCIKH